MLLALDNLAAPLVGAQLSWRESLTGPQFGTLVGKLLFKVFVFTLVLCGYVWLANTHFAAHADTLLFPILPLLVLVGVPLLYAYLKLVALRLHGLGLSAFWLLLLYPLTEAWRLAFNVGVDVLTRNHYILVNINAFTAQRSLMVLMLILMALPSPKKVRAPHAHVATNTQYFYIAYFFIVLIMLGVFNAGPLQYGVNINIPLEQLP